MGDFDKAPASPAEGAPASEGAGAAGSEGAGAGENTTPRTYTQDEVGGMQSKHDTQVKAMRADFDKQLEAIRTENAESMKQVNDYNRTKFIKSVEDAGGDVKWASEQFDKDLAVKERETKLFEREAKLESASKMVRARDFIDEYGLDKGAMEELVSAKSMPEMELAAMKLKVQKDKIAGTPNSKPIVPGSPSQSTANSELSARDRAAAFFERQK